MGTRTQQGVLTLLVVVAACGKATPTPAPPPLEPERRIVVPPRRSTGALSQAERDSLLREAAARREVWRSRQISDYRIQIAVGCFCPWPSNPAILDVRGGVIVALRDTTGQSLGKPREPWSLYTVDGLFHAVEQGAQRSDVIQVGYDPEYGFPALISGVGRVGLPDNWFWVRASRLTPER
jgi:hypothetical protein